MLRNYFKTAFRNILRNKLFTSLNILGLSLGLATAILILFWVQDELSYDKYHSDHEQMYRVNADYDLNGSKINVCVAPPPMAQALMRDYPEVLLASRLRQIGSRMLEVNEKKFRVMDITYADSTFFEMFNIPVLAGDPKNLLNQPNFIMLSRTTADKLFGEEVAIGKSMKVGEDSYMVSGVYEDIPENTHFHFEALLSMTTFPDSHSQTWLSNNYHTYLRVHPDTDIEKLVEQMQEMIVNYMGPDIERLMGKTMDEFLGEGSAAFKLQKVTDIHLKSDLMAELESNSDINNVYIFSFIAVFILIVACINFMNMATARSEGRSKEVGIRKVSGARREQIITQYLLESLVITFISYFLSMIIVEIALPWFNNISGKSIEIQYFDPQTILMLLSIIFITGLLAGSYPSFYLSSFLPVETLKGTLKTGKSGGRLRNILVVVQFITTIVLISSSIFVYSQLQYIQNKKLGFEKENLILLHNMHLFDEKANVLKQELLNYPEIISGSISSFLPVPSSSNNSVVFPDGDRNAMVSMFQWTVDEDYIDTYKMKLVEGRALSREYGTDSLAVVVNQAMLRQIGWTEGLGHFLELYVNEQGETAKYKIVGVLEDFHYQSVKENISPMLMSLGRLMGVGNRGYYLTLRYESDNTQEVINLLEKKWKEFAPNHPFEYSFVNERFNDIYFQEQRIGKIMRIFTALAIIIASLGLFGLAAFIAEKRTKEIGIRKVNGANLGSIFMLFTSDIAKLVLISFVLAVPFTWYIMDQWLNNFSYRIDIHWAVFVLSGLFSFMIALLTISYHAYIAATKNPVDALKYE